MDTLTMTQRYRIEIGRPARIGILLVGCGGTGSFLALHLARMAYHARVRGLDIQMTFVDPDHVEEKTSAGKIFAAPRSGAARRCRWPPGTVGRSDWKSATGIRNSSRRCWWKRRAI